MLVHIYISDMISVLLECIQKKKIGIFNLASGEVNSFYNLAKIIVESTDSNSKVYKTNMKCKIYMTYIQIIYKTFIEGI